MYIPVTSRQYMFIPIDAPPYAGDVTQYPPEAALIADDGTYREPADSDYHPASWIGGEVALLVGAGGGVVYPAGQYLAFGRLSAGAERVVLPAGRVRIGDARA